MTVDEQQVNEEGDIYDNRYTKLASLIDSVMKTNAKNEIGQPWTEIACHNFFAIIQIVQCCWNWLDTNTMLKSEV